MEIENTKLLGTVITNDMKLDMNTKELVRKANARMRILHKISEYNTPIEDMVKIYVLFDV